MKLEEILEIAMRLGTIILQCGAEIYRVETAIKKVLDAYQVQGDCFVLSTAIILSAKGKDGQTLTQIKRTQAASTHLYKLEIVNQFSRDLERQPLPYGAAMHRLSEIEKIPAYSFGIKLLAAGAISFSFTFFFEGTVYDALAAGSIALLIFLLQAKVFGRYFFTFIEYFLASFLTGLLCVWICSVFDFLNVIRVIIGTIMILVPGTTITAAMKDALNGDILSSSYKFAETVFIATAISTGIGLSLSILWR